MQACQLILVLISHPLMSTPSLKREENDPWPAVCECCLSAEEVGGRDSKLNAVDSEEQPITLL